MIQFADEIIYEMIQDIVNELISECIPPKKYSHEWNGTLLNEKIKEIFGLNLPIINWLDEEGVDESSYLHSQIESANQRIERLQSEMIFVQSSINSLSDKRKISIKPDQTKLNEGQESSKENHQTSKETS